MKWKQFFTPITSLTWEEAHRLDEKKTDQDVIFLDVRQPKEYERGHLPGAKLIPLGDLEKRLDEIDRQTPIVIY